MFSFFGRIFYEIRTFFFLKCLRSKIISYRRYNLSLFLLSPTISKGYSNWWRYRVMRYLSVWSSSRLENGIHLVFTTPGGIFNPPQKAWDCPKHTGKIINDNFIIPGSLMVSYRLFAIMCFVYFQPLFEGGWKGFYLLPIIICERCSPSVKHDYKTIHDFGKGLRRLIILDRNYCFNSIGHKYKPFVLYVLTPRNESILKLSNHPFFKHVWHNV